MAVYPRIKGVPDEHKKQHYREVLSKIVNDNNKTGQARTALSQQHKKEVRNEFNEEANRLYALDQEEKELRRREQLLRNLDT